MQKQHLLVVLFGTNLMSNINTKALKKHLNAWLALFKIKIRYIFNAGGVLATAPNAPPDSFF